jgi:pimeloyl-ACP methyl ester carboxylesterase
VITFGLVHGAWHGAWCWDLVAAELRERGHGAVAVDLPCDDPRAGAEAYAGVVLDALADADDVVLVGHSLGGLTIPVVAQERRIRAMVYLAPLLPTVGSSFDDCHAAEPDRLMPGLGAGQIPSEDGSSVWQPQAAIALMYPDAPPGLADWAAARLRRQCWRVSQEVTPLRASPALPVTVIACGADAVVNPDWVRRSARVRFGVEAVVLPGDHSPFLARPAQLADLLVTAAESADGSGPAARPAVDPGAGPGGAPTDPVRSSVLPPA